jgi:peptide subunit release factor 1 (eRF1)
METQMQQLVQRLAEIEPLDEPPGEAGVTYISAAGTARACAPVISAYLDMSLRAVGTRPAKRSGAIVLRERLREIARTFWPRGAAYRAVQADADRIEQYLIEQASPAARGIAVFASAQHHLFEVLETSEPFENEVSVRATPSLFQLVRLLDDQETAVVAVVALNVARLFVMRSGRLIEAEHRVDDPKFYHKIRGTAVMNQKRYQHHADMTRAEFAQEVAGMVERLVQREGAAHVVVAGEQEAIMLLRGALPQPISKLVAEQSPRLDVRTPMDIIAEEAEPVLRRAEVDEKHGVVEQLLAGVQADELGIVGIEPTRAALDSGQVDVLVLSGTAAFPVETRSQLIELAARTGARVEVVSGGTALDQLGGVGAVLRYRISALTEAGTSLAPLA